MQPSTSMRASVSRRSSMRLSSAYIGYYGHLGDVFNINNETLISGSCLHLDPWKSKISCQHAVRSPVHGPTMVDRACNSKMCSVDNWQVSSNRNYLLRKCWRSRAHYLATVRRADIVRKDGDGTQDCKNLQAVNCCRRLDTSRHTTDLRIK